MANIFKRLYDGTKNGLRSFTSTVKATPMGHKSSIFFNVLGGMVAPDDKYVGVVYACIDAIIQQTCQASPKLMHYNENGEAKRDFDHPLIRLLYKPNSQQTWRDLMRWTVGYREVTGNAFWYIQPAASGRPYAIFVLDPRRMRAQYNDDSPTPDEEVTKWLYTTPFGFQMEFSPDEIVSFPHFSPYSQVIGIGPMQAARIEQENDLLAQEFNNKTLKNGAMLSGILSTDQQLTDETAERVRKNWHDAYEGKDNYGKTAVLEAGLKYERLSLTLEDMAFYDGREDARKAIMQIFRVPPMLLGTSDTITRANAEASIYSFAAMKIKPMLDEIFERINMMVLPKFGLDPMRDKLEFSNVVPEDKELQLKMDTELNKIDAITDNEIRSRRNLPPVPWGDLPHSQIVEMYKNGGNPLEPVEVQTDDDDEDENNPNGDDNVQVSKRALDGRFNHVQYRVDFEKLNRSLVRSTRKRVDKVYTQAAEKITEHLARFWPDEKRQLRAQDLRAVVRAMPGELNSIMPEIEDLILYGITATLVEGVYKTSGLTFEYLLGASGSGMYLDNPLANEWVLENSLKDASSISLTMKKVAQEVVSDAIVNGASTYQLKENLKAKFVDMTDWKAEQIAITETHKAMSYAAHQTALEMDQELYKSWHTAEDDRVCEHCEMNAEAGWIPMMDAYPHGEASPEDEHPNGRCVEFFEPAEWHRND